MVFTYGVGSPEARAASARFIVTREPIEVTGLILRYSDANGYIYEDLKSEPHVRTTAPAETFKVRKTAPTRLEFEGNGDQGFSVVTVADQWYPGWSASFNGRPIKVSKGPYIFRTLTLTPRMQEESRTKVFVEMRYEPMSIRIGLYALCLTLCGAAALTVAAIGGRLSRRRRSC